MFGHGGSITNNRYNTSLGSNLSSSGGITAAYGQLYLGTAVPSLDFGSSDNWIPIPFDAFGPSLDVNGSTSSPATMTLLKAGVYAINMTLYFSSEDSPEGTFDRANYTIGIKKNTDSIIPVSTVYASDPGFFSISYNELEEFSEGDFVRFYIKSSNVGPDPIFSNVVGLISGNANLIQIAE